MDSEPWVIPLAEAALCDDRATVDGYLDIVTLGTAEFSRTRGATEKDA